MKKEVVVVIGDLIRSRKIADRADVQRRLRKTLEKINRTYHDSILARLMLTRGDEFEGVLKDAKVC